MIVEIQAGTRIGKYVLQERLGRGAAGEVWRALEGSREVAIKFMNLPDNEQERERYRKSLESEVKALGKLQHPHIPALYDYDLQSERPYLAMQYVGGLTYDHLIASGDLLRIPITKRLNALHDIATTVVAAHQRGIIHRDIKPANISGVDHPYLLDFGIALESWHSSRSQPQVGTAIYMPPDGLADVLSDNYSFAVLAYEVLFGRHPIFTPDTIGKSVLETRQIAGDFLTRSAWRLPSRVPLPEIPGDLYGANLERLDAIFAQAFGARADRYTDLLRLVNDLREAILIPENESYLDHPAPPLVQPARIPTEAAYTANEVAIDRQPTDHGLGRFAPHRSRNWPLVASTLLLLMGLVLIGLWVLSNRGF